MKIMKHFCWLALLVGMAVVVRPDFGYSQSPEADMVHRLELALGRPFSTSQRLDLETATRTAVVKLRPDREAFIRNISRITGMSAQEISAAMSGVPPEGTSGSSSVIPLLEAKKGGAFSAVQKKEVTKTEEDYKTAAYPQIEGFVREAAFILGLDTRDIRPWIFRMGF